MNKVDKLERKGRFVKADQIRATRKKAISQQPSDGASIASEIIDLVKASIFNVLSEKELNTAIFYIEKMAESHLKSLHEALSASIQEVLDKKMGVDLE